LVNGDKGYLPGGHKGNDNQGKKQAPAFEFVFGKGIGGGDHDEYLETDDRNNNGDGISQINGKGHFVPGFSQILKLGYLGDKGSWKGINFLVRLEGHGDHPEKGKYKNANNNNLNTNIQELENTLY
jgi:hypothetical protein